MNIVRKFILLIGFCLLGHFTCADTLTLPEDDFPYSFTESPFVHPRIIHELTGSLADAGDQVVSINLLDAQGSDRYSGEIETNNEKGQHPFVICRMGREMFAYQFVGMASNGIHVLLTAWSGGGSGTFRRLLLVTVERDKGLNTDLEKGTIRFSRPRLLLKKIGEIGLGDRWKGDLKVEGNRLYIGKDTGWFGPRGDNGGVKLAGWHDLEAYGQN